MLKFDLTFKKKNEIQKSHLNSAIRLKQQSKFEFYFLFFEKIENGTTDPFLWEIYVMWLIRGVLRRRKYFVKKGTEVHFSIFIGNWSWDLKFVFQFDKENEKRKKLKFLISNVPFDPRIKREPFHGSPLGSFNS